MNKLVFFSLIAVFLLSVAVVRFPATVVSVSNILPAQAKVRLASYYTNRAEKFFLDEHDNNLSLIYAKSATELDESSYYTWYLLGRIYFVLSDLPSSKASFSKSIEINPSYKISYYGRGLTNGYQGNLYQAEYDFKKYLELSESEKTISGKYDYGHWAGYNDLAWIYFTKGDLTSAENIVRQGLEKYNNPWLLNMLGSILLNQGRKKEALEEFQKALDYTGKMTAAQFGEAYTGDDPTFHGQGFEKMKNIIQENIVKSSE